MNNTTEVKRKKQKKITSDHWMCRLQEYTFGIDAKSYYMGYCPFFWMTWVALICFPLVALIKLLSIPVSRVYDYGDDYLQNKKIVRRERVYSRVVIPSDTHMLCIALETHTDDYVNVYTIFRIAGNVTMARAHQYLNWFNDNPGWRKSYLPAAKRRIAEALAIANKDKERRAARVNRLFAITRTASLCGSFVFKLLIPVIILAIGALLYLLGAIVVMSVTLPGLIGVLGIVSGALAAIIFAYLVFDGTRTIADIILSRPRSEKLTAIAKMFVLVRRFFSVVFEFITDTVRNTYKAECPLIIWGDETGPIEKNTQPN